jgi:hypothetical protein
MGHSLAKEGEGRTEKPAGKIMLSDKRRAVDALRGRIREAIRQAIDKGAPKAEAQRLNKFSKALG